MFLSNWMEDIPYANILWLMWNIKAKSVYLLICYRPLCNGVFQWFYNHCLIHHIDRYKEHCICVVGSTVNHHIGREQETQRDEQLKIVIAIERLNVSHRIWWRMDGGYVSCLIASGTLCLLHRFVGGCDCDIVIAMKNANLICYGLWFYVFEFRL